MSTLLLRHWRYIAGAVLLLVALALGYAWAHGRGYRAAEAHYEPILAAIREEAVRAEERARAAEAASRRAVQRITEEYERRADEIESRAAASRERLVERLRDAQSRACAVSEDAGAAAGTDGAAGGSGHDERDRAARAIAARAAEIGARCERDAARLRALQDYVRALPR